MFSEQYDHFMSDAGKRLQGLLEKIKKIQAARKKNAELRCALQRRLSYVDAQLFVMRKEQQIYPYGLFYEQHRIWGIYESDVAKLVQLFWGKNRLESGVDQGNRPARPRSTGLSPLVQRSNFMNSRRNARQRSVICKIQPMPRVTAFTRPSLCFVDPRFIIMDAVRYIVMKAVFGESFSLRTVYPCMNVRKIRTLIARFSNYGKKEKNLCDYGIDLEAIRTEIRRTLNPLGIAPSSDS
jgi:hypothetical protein